MIYPVEVININDDTHGTENSNVQELGRYIQSVTVEHWRWFFCISVQDVIVGYARTH